MATNPKNQIFVKKDSRLPCRWPEKNPTRRKKQKDGEACGAPCASQDGGSLEWRACWWFIRLWREMRDRGYTCVPPLPPFHLLHLINSLHEFITKTHALGLVYFSLFMLLVLILLRADPFPFAFFLQRNSKRTTTSPSPCSKLEPSPTYVHSPWRTSLDPTQQNPNQLPPPATPSLSHWLLNPPCFTRLGRGSIERAQHSHLLHVHVHVSISYMYLSL